MTLKKTDCFTLPIFNHNCQRQPITHLDFVVCKRFMLFFVGALKVFESVLTFFCWRKLCTESAHRRYKSKKMRDCDSESLQVKVENWSNSWHVWSGQSSMICKGWRGDSRPTELGARLSVHRTLLHLFYKWEQEALYWWFHPTKPIVGTIILIRSIRIPHCQS